ncbi:MAG: hypothetical protein ABI151_17900, partial [Chitinophagaceae bacterium]
MIKYKSLLSVLLCFLLNFAYSQVHIDSKAFSKKAGASFQVSSGSLTINWPAGNSTKGRLIIDLETTKPLFKSIGLQEGSLFKQIATDLDPVFLLTIGKRDLVSQNGWNIFFDRVPLKPFTSYKVDFKKQDATLSSVGSRTIVTIGTLSAADFTGNIEITLYHGSPLINIAAVMSTQTDSTAIVFDAGLISKTMNWTDIAWSDVDNKMQSVKPALQDTSRNEAVKYRTIIGKTTGGSLAVFPGPHQYFYPLDEAFNLRFTWHGNEYRKMVDGYGIGIRQDLYGDNRFVPWFNAPPGTRQRMNFFCLLASAAPALALEEVKKFTHNDRYVALPGYKTMSSHFHNEFIM